MPHTRRPRSFTSHAVAACAAFATLAAATAGAQGPGGRAPGVGPAASTIPPAQRPDPRTEARVDSVLRLMTLEEKVGEMTQLTSQAVSSVRGTAAVAQQLDSAKLERAVVGRHVGSLLNVWDAALTPEAWRQLTGAVQRAASRSRLKIPVLYGIDAVHGEHYMRGATLFPQNVAMAATWNPELVRREHQITAYETRASGIPWNFAPVLDVGRQPLWPRFYETFGEDAYLGSVLGAVAVEGEQRDPRPALAGLLGGAGRAAARGGRARPVGGSYFVAASAKHFLGYGMPLSGKDRTTALIPERQLREIVLPPFRAAIDAGIRTVMVNSGDINGVPVHSSREILTDLLRTELGFTGVAVSDWADVDKLVSFHHSAANNKDAVRQAVLAGIDMSMVPYDFTFTDDLLALVREGTIPESRIDQSVRRILRLKFELGLFDNPNADPAMLANVGAAPFAAVSRQAANEAVTLLKNDRGLLPLARTARVLVTGPAAAWLPAQYGGWSYTWQGTDTALYPKNVKTLLDAVRDRVGAARVSYVPAATFDGKRDGPADVAAAVAAARDADVIVVALGENASAEQPGNIDDLTLPPAQLQLAQALEATGKPVVLALYEGRPRVIRSAVDAARAIVLGYETGPFGGEAVADVLFGAVNPSGRLPFSYPRYTGAIEHYDRTQPANSTAGDSTTGYHPEFDFGHGLSYTTYAYSGLRLDRARAGAGDTVSLSVTVANTGPRAGMEVVQVYSRQQFASVNPSVRRLRDFRKVSLAPGERRTVTFRIPVQRLAFVGRDNRLAVEAGDVDFLVGALTSRLGIDGGR